MPQGSVSIHRSLITRLILLVGFILSVSIFIWAYFNIEYQRKFALKEIVESSDRLGTTIKLGTHYAMMLNSRDDINQITKNIGRQEGVENIRIYNKSGQIKFSSRPEEVDTITGIRTEACDICHKSQPPAEELALSERTRIFESSAGHRLLGVISPIYNETSCAAEACHFHPQNKKVLGAVDVVISLKTTDAAIQAYESRIIFLALISLVAISAIIGAFLFIFVNRPIRSLIAWTRQIALGNYDHPPMAESKDEIGQLAHAIGTMERRIGQKQEELNRQRYEYQELFEQVPCYITVQDSNFRLLRHNREFARNFSPRSGEHCYEVYKGRTEICPVCPVLKTFADGESHFSEEAGVTREGKRSAWIVRTSPLRDQEGNIVAVMEMSIDVTEQKLLQEEIRKSEGKYREIFNNIPNPIFVLDRTDLKILDSNDMAASTYGFTKEEFTGMNFLDLFEERGRYGFANEVRNAEHLNSARQRTRDGRTIYVNVRVSPSEYLGRETFLVSTSDITKRLMAEQQLIQASKMATLGEMATGVAHELNQPLSVIKTASSFIVKKIKRQEPIKPEILQTMAEEIDSHVDRASGIINHLREFGRKSEVRKESVDVNEALENALAIFLQQLKLREIQVVKDLEEGLPPVLANANRLEQVFINLLINARDAIEERSENDRDRVVDKAIMLRTRVLDGNLEIEIKDTGVGIPKALLEKIFEPFFTTKTVGKGTGLGLSISYGIVQDYDGSITVRTIENEGSTFMVRFPVAGEVS